MQLNPVRWPLKNKFISIILLVLLIPASSIILLKEIERGLVDNLKQNLLLSAQIYSLQLESNNQWFEESNLPDTSNYQADELFVFPMQQSMEIDGYFDEWLFVERFRQRYLVGNNKQGSDALTLLLGADEEYLYLSIEGFDSQIIYQEASPSVRSDQLQIQFRDRVNRKQQVYITPQAPGKIPVKKYFNNQLIIDWRYKATWIETDKGFNLEMQFPSGIRPTQLMVRHLDVDRHNLKTYEAEISSSRSDTNPMVWPSSQLSDFVKQLQVISGQRVSVLDTQGRVLARKGGLENPSVNEGGLSLFGWLLSDPTSEVIDTRRDRLRLNSSLVFSALDNRPSTMVESFSQGDYAVALAATPISNGEQVVGAVLIEENVARVQLLQRQTLAQLLNVMFAIFIVIMTIVVWYVSRLVRRVSRLQNQVSSLVDEKGRMSEPLSLEVKKGDEVDELNNAFQRMGNKLYEYHEYLEKLASRLSHELRTPIAIVRSSLDNLLLTENEPQRQQTIHRAVEGTQRLGEIIRRMRQASGVREAMQSAELESIDLNLFLSQFIEGFRQTFSEQQFQFIAANSPQFVEVSPDLLAESLDKLLNNAMDFSKSGTPIIVRLDVTRHLLTLSVNNQGPTIAERDQERIFDSLVSLRDQEFKQSVNLGLGLYVVRLIAEFHQASAEVKNLEDNSGVSFNLVWTR